MASPFTASPMRICYYSALILIFFWACFSLSSFGRVMVSTPFLKEASAFSVFTSLGMGKTLVKVPKERSR